MCIYTSTKVETNQYSFSILYTVTNPFIPTKQLHHPCNHQLSTSAWQVYTIPNFSVFSLLQLRMLRAFRDCTPITLEVFSLLG